jgi:hypothetical protein
MLTVLILALVYAGGRALVARAWRDVPRSNDDMVFY